jgi:hypothetical protein
MGYMSIMIFKTCKTQYNQVQLYSLDETHIESLD